MTWWVDATYTRTQLGGAIGITRTVRRLHGELVAAGHAVEAVAFHSEGFRCVSLLVAAANGRNGQGLFRILTGGVARRLVPLALRVVPWSWLQPLWQRSSNAAFDALARTGDLASMRRGDVLLMADASWNYAAWQAAARARSAGARVILIVYDLMPLRHPEFCFPIVPRLYASWLEKMLACSDAVICISQATQDDVQDWASERRLALPPMTHFRLGSDPGAGVAAVAVRPAIEAFLGDHFPCFAAVGSFEPKKDYPTVVAAFEQLWSAGVKVKLMLAGRPTSDCAALIDALHRHPQKGALLMTVHDATDAEVDRVYQRSRALVLASLFEGFGLPLVEARTRGCPVIASDLPVFSELADGGVTFFVRQSASSLAGAVKDHLLRDHRAEVGCMQPFLWRDSAAQLVGRVETLLAAGR